MANSFIGVIRLLLESLARGAARGRDGQRRRREGGSAGAEGVLGRDVGKLGEEGQGDDERGGQYGQAEHVRWLLKLAVGGCIVGQCGGSYLYEAAAWSSLGDLFRPTQFFRPEKLAKRGFGKGGKFQF